MNLKIALAINLVFVRRGFGGVRGWCSMLDGDSAGRTGAGPPGNSRMNYANQN